MKAIRLLNHLTSPTLYQVRAEAPTARAPVARANITIISFPPTPTSEKRAA